MSPDAVVNTAQIASALGMKSRKAVAHWRSRYGLTPIGKDGNARLYRWADVLAAKAQRDKNLEENRAQLPPTPSGFDVKAYALDLEDLAHQTQRGDVDAATWYRVCAGRFRAPPSESTLRRALERWRSALCRMRIPWHLVDTNGEPVVGRIKGDQDAPLMRFDWPNVLRWTRHVLD